jgi:type VI protein secretion system component Hcp
VPHDRRDGCDWVRAPRPHRLAGARDRVLHGGRDRDADTGPARLRQHRAGPGGDAEISDEVALSSAEGTGGDSGGTLQVRPLVVIKELDRCTPPLFLALVNRERIRLVEIRLFDQQGVHFFTIRLEDALITRISRVVRSHGLHEEVAFAFRAIQLIDERSGASASYQFSG